jgi:transmembrane E3 ubiquitin-protein ligase
MASDPRSFILVVLFLYLLFSGDIQPGPGRFRFSGDDYIAREWQSLEILNSTSYGDFSPRSKKWLNLTGLREADGYDWELMDVTKQRAKEQIKHALDGHHNSGPDNINRLPLYHNITGTLHGDWIRLRGAENIQPPNLNLTAIQFTKAYHFQEEFDRNITSPSGSLRLGFHDIDDAVQVENKTVRKVAASLNIREDSSLGTWWQLTLYGVHFVDSGNVLLTTTSDK